MGADLEGEEKVEFPGLGKGQQRNQRGSGIMIKESKDGKRLPILLMRLFPGRLLGR